MEMLHGIVAATIAAVAAVAPASPADGFASPTREFRPETWWWFDPAAPDSAIRSDLAAMKAAGLSGFFIFPGRQSENGGPAGFDFDSPIPDAELVPKVRLALAEAARLDLDAWLMIGVSCCSHPLTRPEHVIKTLACSAADGIRDGLAIRCSLPPRASVQDCNASWCQRRAIASIKGPPVGWRDIVCLAVPAVPNAPVSSVVDVSRFLDAATGDFMWPDAPGGEWRILRAGYFPLAYGAGGCFIDNMSREAFDAHFKNAVEPVLSALTPEERSALKGVFCDSWEVGRASWTPKMPEEFLRRRGYRLEPWLVVQAAGLEIGTEAERTRFRRDYAETVSELIAENHYAYQREVANRHGLLSLAEAAGPNMQQGDVRRMQGRCDIAMGEFWTPSAWAKGKGNPPDRRPAAFAVRDSATAAHVYGIRETLAEAFTTVGTSWLESPATLKPIADRAFCDGMTRVCYHGWALQNRPGEFPGFVRRPGIHYNPQTTWFRHSSAFNLYLSRCSWALSQGRFAADCLVYAGDGEKVLAKCKTPSDGIGEGFDYDICPTEILLAARAERGEIVLPCGMRYKVLYVSGKTQNMKHFSDPSSRPFVPAAAERKIRELAASGVAVADARKGEPAAAAARAAGLAPDFEAEGLAAGELDWIHRTDLPGGGDLYFVSNQRREGVSFEAALRVVGRIPEIWDPVTGAATPPASWRCDGRRTRVSLSLPPHGSTFIVFREKGCPDTPDAAPASPAASTALSTRWRVSFDPAWGGPEKPVAFDSLQDWASRPEPGIRHYSGLAVYRAKFDAPPGWKTGDSARIDLGEVRETAEVLVNGESCGIVWTRPYAVVARNVRSVGNDIEVRVANLWPNRLIGDAALPEGERFTKTSLRPFKAGDRLLPSGLLGPVTISAVAPPAQDVVVECPAFRLVLDPAGFAKSLVMKATGEECLAPGVRIPFALLRQGRPYDNEAHLIHPAKPVAYQSSSIVRRGDALEIGFSGEGHLLRLKVVPAGDAIAFVPEGTEYRITDNFGDKRRTEIDGIDYVRLAVRDRARYGECANVVWDEAAAVCLMGLAPEVRIDGARPEGTQGWRLFSAASEAASGLFGFGASLVVSSPSRFLDGVDAIERAFGLPRGAANRRDPLMRASYLKTGDIQPSNVEEEIAWMKKGGFRVCMVSYTSFAKTCGHYEWKRDRYPNGLRDIVKVCDALRAAGVVPALHIHYNKVSTDDGYITDPRLACVREVTLAKDLAADAAEAALQGDSGGMRTDDSRRIVRFGDEILSYESVVPGRPWRLAGLKRGLFGTSPAFHPAGEFGRHLDVDEWPRFVRIDQTTDIQDEIAERIAAIVDACGFRLLYLDGAEDVPPPYWRNVPLAQKRVWDRLKTKPAGAESALKSHFGWHMANRGNAFDTFYPECQRLALDKFVIPAARLAADDFSTVDFGWFGVWKPGEKVKPASFLANNAFADVTAGTTGETAELVARAAYEAGAPVSLQFSLEEFRSHPHADDIMAAFRKYEEMKWK